MARLLFLLSLVVLCSSQDVINFDRSSTCNFSLHEDIPDCYSPKGPRILCCLVPEEFYTCEELKEEDDTTLDNETGVCSEFSNSLFYEDISTTSVNCTVLDGVECCGNTWFIKTGVPCVRYNGFYFPTIVLFSVFLGILGVDRFCLGYTCLGVAKLLTLGALGVWWVVDVILLLAGQTNPNDGYSWEQYY